MRRLAMLTALALGTLALPAQGSAQSFRTTVTGQLEAAARQVAGDGYRIDSAVFDRNLVIGMLKAGTASFMELNLTAGAGYVIAAGCDEDCTDLDLQIFAPGESKALAEDVGEDDVPVIRFQAPKSGQYMLAVNMAACSESLCYYGYQVYKK